MTAYQALVESLRRALLNGDLRPGDSLPPLRDLCAAYGQPDAGIATARRAVHVLAREGC